MVDNWGMYNRECVSYTAWKVYESGETMPYWGGEGDAYQWVGNAESDGIPVSSTPQAGDVGIYPKSGVSPLGHAVYVESVNSNGTINISQYNANDEGDYSMVYNLPISGTGIQFINFGG
jgi:surface antigen